MGVPKSRGLRPPEVPPGYPYPTPTLRPREGRAITGSIAQVHRVRSQSRRQGSQTLQDGSGEVNVFVQTMQGRMAGPN